MMKTKRLRVWIPAIFALFLAVFISGCKDENVAIIGVCPVVVSTIPANLAVDVPLNQVISATFNEKMNASSITPTSFIISGVTPVGGITSTGTAVTTSSFTPSAPLAPFTTYTGTIKTSAKDLNGNFLQTDYVWTFKTIPQVNVSALPLIGGTATGGGTFPQSSLVTVAATPNTGYAFSNWTYLGVVVSTSASYQFTMNGNKDLVANFIPVVVGNFAVVLSSLPIAGGTTGGAGSYTAGSTVNVIAYPNPLYSFVNWTEGATIVSTSSNYQFVLNANRALVANYKLIPVGQFAVILSSNPIAGGTTNGSGSFNTGTSVTVTAAPNVGYDFVNWTDGATVASTSASYTFPLSTNRTLVANFAVSTYTLTVTSVNGTVLSIPTQTTYNYGTQVTLTPTANTGYTFTSWTGDATGNTNPLVITMNANKNITANFTINTYTLTVNAVNGTVLKVPTQTTYNYGTLVTLTPTASTGYTFTSWTGDATGNTNPLIVTMNANKIITANFTINTYTVNVTAVNGTVAKLPSQATYNYGAMVALTATPNAGYSFTSWSGDATGTVNPLSVNVNANKNITANFAPSVAIGPIIPNLGTYNILTKSGISTTGVTSVVGNIGVSPATATAITGFGLIMSIDGQSSHTPIVSGLVYAADYAPPTPANISAAVSLMETAYNTAMGLTVPAPVVELGAGNISGMTLAPGLYKWGTGLLISNAGVTLSGGPNDTWVFQISQDLTVNNSAIITLAGGAQAKNILWVTGSQALLGSNVIFKGNILSKTLISLNTGASVTGQLGAQTAVTLNASTVLMP
jgi:uncharacterized repeat protein (TIGR02543 family)